MTNKSKTKASKKTNNLAVDTRSFWERNEASNGILLNETIKKYAISIFRGILLFGMCFMILQPLLNKIALSFMAEKDLYDTTIILIPKHFFNSKEEENEVELFIKENYLNRKK